MESLIKKENEIFKILQLLKDQGPEFIVVGGYAVSSYKHRFSVDADIVISIGSIESLEKILNKEGFKKTISKDLLGLYLSKFVRYEKDEASLDILIGALASRQTGASFSFEFLKKNSRLRKIIGIEKEVELLVPEKEILIAMKIHSARLTDFRDIAALSKDSDLEKIRRYLFIGDLNVLKSNLKELNKAAKDPKFIDAFKGVFMEKKFDVDIAK